MGFLQRTHSDRAEEYVPADRQIAVRIGHKSHVNGSEAYQYVINHIERRLNSPPYWVP